MAHSSVTSPRGIAAVAGVLVLLAGTLAGPFGWQAFLGVYAGMFLLIPLAACTVWGVLKLWETGSRLATDGVSADERRGDCEEEPHDPLSVLRGRYAAGELDETEFEARVETLLRTADADGIGFESTSTTFTAGADTEPVRRSRDPTTDD